MTAGELASLDSIERVDVAEISPGVMNAAPLFDFANMNASKQQKIKVIESDAYRALIRSDVMYDLVVSEPSNPWVAGIEMLFSREFLMTAKSKLTEGGIYCQWFHQYEVDAESLEVVLRTYRDVFDHVAVWRGKSNDLMILGFNKAGAALDHYRLEARAAKPDYEAALRRSGVSGFAALLAHEVLPLGVVHEASLEGPLHTLYHPILSDIAGRAFYRDGRGELPFTGFGEAARIGHRNSMTRAYFERFGGNLPDVARVEYAREKCVLEGPKCMILLAHWLEEKPDLVGLRALRDDVAGVEGSPSIEEFGLTRHLFGDGRAFASAGPIGAAEAFGLTEAYRTSYNHGIPFSAAALEAAWSSCRQRPPTRAQCERSAASAEHAGDVIVADASPSGFDASVAACMVDTKRSVVCRDASIQARTMLETGESPRLLEAWLLKRQQAREVELNLPRASPRSAMAIEAAAQGT